MVDVKAVDNRLNSKKDNDDLFVKKEEEGEGLLEV